MGAPGLRLDSPRQEEGLARSSCALEGACDERDLIKVPGWAELGKLWAFRHSSRSLLSTLTGGLARRWFTGCLVLVEDLSVVPSWGELELR